MKLFSLLLVAAFFSGTAAAQTLFTFGNTAVDKEEFLRAFNKNKTETANKEQAMREYLELYANFKLKVKAARDMHLDTLPQLVNDLQNFRSQVDESYMNNDNALNQLVDEAAQHAQKDLHTLHFFIPADEKTTAADSLKAAKAANELFSGLQAGKKDYDKLAADLSAKYTTVKLSDIGYITAFTVPYEYEKIIYGLKPNTASKPYHTKKGWHVFVMLDERKNSGRWRVAQILLAFPPGDTESTFRIQQQKADSLYKMLQGGADFAALAKEFSNDKITYLSGGELPEFTSGRYQQDFEKEVFKLAKDGEISKPFATTYGFHIVKRIGVKPTPADINDVSFRYEIKQKVLQDTRMANAKEMFNQSVLKQVAYKRNAAVTNAELFRYADSVVADPGGSETKKFPVASKPVYSFAKNTLTGADWLRFIREYKTNPELYKGESNTALLDKFVAVKSLDYYRAHLEEYNTEFRYQMEEFKEGNLLFEIMERKIWGAAANDNAGLKKYYAEHKNNYLWGASAEVLIFNCVNKNAADTAWAAVKNGADWKKIGAASNNTIQADSGRYELAQVALPEGTVAAPGMVTPITLNTTDGSASFIKILQLHAAGQQRSFDEAHGLVVNDYQSLMEQKWIEELRKKYPVKINEPVFQSLLK